jgi:hypothetical protein
VASASRPTRVRRVTSNIWLGLSISFMTRASFCSATIMRPHEVPNCEYHRDPMRHHPSPHPVGESGLDRRTGVQGSQYDDRGDCGASKLRRDIYGDTGEAQHLDVEHLSS